MRTVLINPLSVILSEAKDLLVADHSRSFASLRMTARYGEYPGGRVAGGTYPATLAFEFTSSCVMM